MYNSASSFSSEMLPTKERMSAKWTDAKDLVFIELCMMEISKGNKPGSSLSKEGWKNVVKGFYLRTGNLLDQKQLKNRWDQMKKEWSLYKTLMQSSSEIGWDPVKKTIEASDEWWEEQIKLDPRYKKFRNRDLTIVASKYDDLFLGTVFNCEKALASTQQSAIVISTDNQDFSFPNIEGNDNNNAKGSGDSYESPGHNASGQEDILFPSPVFQKGSSSRSKRKRSNMSAIKDGIQSLLNIALTKTTEPSEYIPHSAPTIEQCMAVLNRLDAIEKYTSFYYFSQSLFEKPANRQIFMNQIDDRARVGWLCFKYEDYQRGTHVRLSLPQ